MENTLEGKAMKPTLWFASVLVAAILGGVVGAGVVIFMGWQERPRAEGIIYSVEYQQGNGTEPEIIPTHRLLSIRFGDGGIKEMPKTAAP
jgi:hypothetical protein